MNVICADCHLEYDDLYQVTYCPHQFFDMHTLITINGVEYCCHSIEELNLAWGTWSPKTAPYVGHEATTCPVQQARRSS